MFDGHVVHFNGGPITGSKVTSSTSSEAVSNGPGTMFFGRVRLNSGLGMMAPDFFEMRTCASGMKRRREEQN